jgi:hypothetical protein
VGHHREVVEILSQKVQRVIRLYLILWRSRRQHALAASTGNPTPTPAGAWQVKNEWNNDYIKKFQDFSASKTNEYSNLGKQFTCEDLALSLIIDFASENNLPFQFTNETGTFNPTDAIYTSVDDYKNAVLKTSGANDLANNNNTTEISMDKAKKGDLILLKTHDDSIKYNHTQVITKITDTQTEISQGNLNYRILSQDPSSSFYGGVDIQEGAYFKDNSYFNKSKMEYHAGDFLTQNRASIRTWNFMNFNKR